MKLLRLMSHSVKLDPDNKVKEHNFQFSQDEGVRIDSTVATLGKLRPAFNVKGSVTAGIHHKQVMVQQL